MEVSTMALAIRTPHVPPQIQGLPEGAGSQLQAHTLVPGDIVGVFER
jgi:hypothetical protein